jgi:hypothetical protein
LSFEAILALVTRLLLGAPAAAKPQPSVGGRKESGIPLNDILYVKELVGRIGPQQLHKLIDAFAK